MVLGSKIKIKLYILIVLFIITGIFVHGYNRPEKIVKKPLLSDYFNRIDGYQSTGPITMSDGHTSMLELDDYVFENFKDGTGTTNLYIGYYYSANKAYSAHSPLVCYPSQGWKIDSVPQINSMNIGPYAINYEEIVTSYGQEKELVLYWYQAHLLTTTKAIKNKINMGYNKLFYNNEQHAFVRVSVSLSKSSYDEAKKQAVKFIEKFYPTFIDFIKNK